jgi:hypothetical protein
MFSMSLSKKEEILLAMLTDSTARGQSYIPQNWSTFEYIVAFLDIDEIKKYHKAFVEFLKKRFESKLSHPIIFNTEGVIDGDKAEALKPAIQEAITRMPPKKFMELYKMYSDQKSDEHRSGHFNIFGYEFIDEILLSDDDNTKKIKKKIMTAKLSR